MKRKTFSQPVEESKLHWSDLTSNYFKAASTVLTFIKYSYVSYRVLKGLPKGLNGTALKPLQASTMIYTAKRLQNPTRNG